MNSTKATTSVWTETEWENFRNVVAKEHPEYLVACDLMYHCGLRLGEVLALNKSDICFANNTIVIDKSLQKVNETTYLGDGYKLVFNGMKPVKYHSAPRTVSMPDDLADVVEGVTAIVDSDDECIFSFPQFRFKQHFFECAKQSGISAEKCGNVYALRKNFLASNGGEIR